MNSSQAARSISPSSPRQQARAPRGSRPGARLLAGATILALLACAGGCDRSSDAQRALTAAQKDLDVLVAGGGSKSVRGVSREELKGATADQLAQLTDFFAVEGSKANQELADRTRATLNAIVSNANKAAGEGDSDPGTTSAAKTILSRAKVELAKLDVAKAVDLSEDLKQGAGQARELLVKWREQSTLGESYAKASLSSEKTNAQTRLNALSADIQGATKQRDALAAQQSEHRKTGEASLAKARELRAKIPALRQGDLTEVQRLAREQQIADLGRQADKADQQASEANAQADELTPQIADQERLIASRTNETALWTKTLDGLVARQRDAAANATRARELATESQRDFATLLGSLRTTRDGSVAASESAEKNLRDALSAAKAAGGTGRAGGSSVAAIQQRLGAVLLQRADTLGTFNSVVAGAQALREGGFNAEFTGDETTLGERIKSLRQQGEESLQSLLGGASDTLRARLGALGIKDASVGAPDAPAPDAPKADAPKGDAKGSSTTQAATDDAAKIAAVRELVVKAAGLLSTDVQAYIALHRFSTPDQARSFRDMMTFANAQLRLDKTIRGKFNRPAKDVLLATAPPPMASGMAPMFKGMDQAAASLAQIIKDPSIATITLTSPTAAKITVPGSGSGDHFSDAGLKDGQWLLEPTPDALQGGAQMGPMLVAFTEIFETIAGEIESGTLATEQAVGGAFVQRVMGAMMKLQGDMDPNK
jgi:hypothetical protein